MSTRKKNQSKKFFLFCVSFLVTAGVILTILLLPKNYFIYYDGEKFTPQGVIIKLGDSVSIKNNSQAKIEFAMGTHENHRLLKGFEEKIIEANTMYTFTPQETGIFDFHNHFNPKKIGVMIINDP